MDSIDKIPHVDFNGFKIYMVDSKMNHLKTKTWWTVSKIQRAFKIGYNAALLLIQYAQSIGVLGGVTLHGGINKWEVVEPNLFNITRKDK